MGLLRTLAARVRALFHRDAVAGEIHEELEFHLKSRTDQYRSEGLAPDAAQRKARERVGNLTLHQDRGYDVRGGGFMETVIQDVRHSLRLLAQQRGFSLVAILTIALGIGASTAIFSVIDAAILHPLPYPHPEQLVEVRIAQFDSRFERVHRADPSLDDLRAWRSTARVFSQIGAERWLSERLVESPEPERLDIKEMTEGYLEALGAAPVAGRAFNSDDMRMESADVALIGYAYWQRRYGGRPDAVGQTIRVDGTPATIVGVLPRFFKTDSPIWKPLRVPAATASRRSMGFHAIGRVRPGLTIDDAARELTAGLAGEPPGPAGPPTAALTSLLGGTASRYRTTVNVIGGAVGLILLIASVNVAGLLLGRGATRRPELAVRASLGAGRLRLVRQLLTESVVLSLAGGAVGVLVAWLTLDAIVANLPMALPADAPATLSTRVLGAALVLTVGTGVVFGLVPALRLSRVQLGVALAGGSRRHGSALSARGGQALVGAEIALAVVLLASAGLMIRSFGRLLTVDIGFDPDAFVTLDAVPIDPATQVQYYPDLLQKIRALPGVESAGAADFVALKGSSIVMGARLDTGESTSLGVRMILPGYFETIGVPIRQGRLLNDADITGDQPVALVNDAAARKLMPTGALGRRIVVAKISYEIVGVVGDMRHNGPGWEVEPEIYRAFKPASDKFVRAQGLTVVVRPRGDVAGLAGILRTAAASVGPRALVERVRSGADWLGDRVLEPHRQTVLLSLLGALGLVLTLVGVLGITSYAVTRRTQEIGVRMAFGAQPGQVVGAIVRDVWLPIATGLATGLGGAYFATTLIQTFLFETPHTDPLTFAAAALVLAAAATVAAWVPARRAARVDPVAALRAE